MRGPHSTTGSSPEESDSSLVLRIEDTDRERSTDEAIEQLIDGLEWLELGWDEGPFRQTERRELYERRLGELLDSARPTGTSRQAKTSSA